MKTKSIFGPIKTRNLQDREVYYRRTETGEWLCREAGSYVWSGSREVPPAILKLSSENEADNGARASMLIW